jgi:hypothetical protein
MTFTRGLLVVAVHLKKLLVSLTIKYQWNISGKKRNEGNIRHFPERRRKILKYISIAGVSAEFLSGKIQIRF